MAGLYHNFVDLVQLFRCLKALIEKGLRGAMEGLFMRRMVGGLAAISQHLFAAILFDRMPLVVSETPKS
jgi:hypothetical protein